MTRLVKYTFAGFAIFSRKKKMRCVQMLARYERTPVKEYRKSEQHKLIDGANPLSNFIYNMKLKIVRDF